MRKAEIGSQRRLGAKSGRVASKTSAPADSERQPRRASGKAGGETSDSHLAAWRKRSGFDRLGARDVRQKARTMPWKLAQPSVDEASRWSRPDPSSFLRRGATAGGRGIARFADQVEIPRQPGSAPRGEPQVGADWADQGQYEVPRSASSVLPAPRPGLRQLSPAENETRKTGKAAARAGRTRASVVSASPSQYGRFLAEREARGRARPALGSEAHFFSAPACGPQGRQTEARRLAVNLRIPAGPRPGG